MTVGADLYIIVAINLLLAAIFFKRQDPTTIWLHVMTIPVAWFILNYPVRAIFLIIADPSASGIDRLNELIPAIVFASIFFWIQCILAGFKQPPFPLLSKMTNLDATTECRLCHLLTITTLISISYQWHTGKVYSLYTSEADLYHSLSYNIMTLCEPLKWFVLPYAFLLWKNTGHRICLVESIVIGVVIIIGAFLATAKAPFLSLTLCYLFLRNTLRTKPHKTVMTGGIFLFICFAIYSYIVRYYGIARGTFKIENIFENFEIFNSVLDNPNEFMSTGIMGLVNRFSYLDGLINVMEKKIFLEKGHYVVGGIAEILNFIPRFIWSDRPLINFNIYLTNNVWGHDVLSETPIGRIAEAYFIMGWAGLLLALFYGFLFRFMMYKFLTHKTPFRMACFFFLLQFYVWPDAHSFFYVKEIVISFVIIYFLRMSVYALRQATLQSHQNVIHSPLENNLL